jgi:hypothetical protein
VVCRLSMQAPCCSTSSSNTLSNRASSDRQRLQHCQSQSEAFQQAIGLGCVMDALNRRKSSE